MIGCVAKAQSYEVLLNASEMEDVQWYDRAELAAAVRAYEASPQASLQEIQRRSWREIGFFVPPPFAVAHHLIRAWALQSRPWFADPQSPPRQLQQAPHDGRRAGGAEHNGGGSSSSRAAAAAVVASNGRGEYVR